MTIQSHILAYIFGTLSNADKIEWESNLVQNAELKTDIKALQKLLAAKNIASQEDFDKLLPKRKDSEEIEEYLQEIERIIRRIKHREYIVSFLEPDEDISAEERADFEAELQTNESLKQKVMGMKEMSELLKTAKNIDKANAIWEYIQEKEKADKQEDTQPKNHFKTIPIWKKPWAIAASVVFLVGLVLGIYFLTQPPAANYDATYFAQTYLNPDYPISGKMGKADEFEQIIGLYKNKKYEEVVNQLVTGKFDSLPKANMMLAMAYLKTNHKEKASPLLEKLKDSGEYGNDARKYLAVIAIVEGDKAKAKTLLTEILQQQADEKQAAEANKILKELDSSAK